MNQIGKVPEVLELKRLLEDFRKKGLIRKWQLPHEDLLSNRESAVVFLNIKNEKKLDKLKLRLAEFSDFTCSKNEVKELSQLQWQLEFIGKRN